MADPGDAAPTELPRIPASAGAMIFDGSGRLLILRPTYKAGWTIPGGQVEEDGESPWEACRRETFEECGLWVGRARLACVDFLHPRPERPGGMRFLFDCGAPVRRAPRPDRARSGARSRSSGCWRWTMRARC